MGGVPVPMLEWVAAGVEHLKQSAAALLYPPRATPPPPEGPFRGRCSRLARRAPCYPCSPAMAHRHGHPRTGPQRPTSNRVWAHTRMVAPPGVGPLAPQRRLTPRHNPPHRRRRVGGGPRPPPSHRARATAPTKPLDVGRLGADSDGGNTTAWRAALHGRATMVGGCLVWVAAAAPSGTPLARLPVHKPRPNGA